MNTDFWFSSFADDVSGAAVGPIFNGHPLLTTSEDFANCGIIAHAHGARRTDIEASAKDSVFISHYFVLFAYLLKYHRVPAL
jgi:hypothetical protein